MTENRNAEQAAGQTAIQIAREVFPDATPEELDWVIWNRTGFPAFWPARFKSPASALRYQLKAFKRANDRLGEHERMCEFCNRKALAAGTLCGRCSFRLDEARGD